MYNANANLLLPFCSFFSGSSNTVYFKSCHESNGAIASYFYSNYKLLSALHYCHFFYLKYSKLSSGTENKLAVRQIIPQLYQYALLTKNIKFIDTAHTLWLLYKLYGSLCAANIYSPCHFCTQPDEIKILDALFSCETKKIK